MFLLRHTAFFADTYFHFFDGQPSRDGNDCAAFRRITSFVVTAFRDFFAVADASEAAAGFFSFFLIRWLLSSFH